MLIVDSHHHFWDAEAAKRPGWRDAYPDMQRPFGPDDLASLMDEHGVQQSVLIQSDNSWDETQVGLEIAAQERSIAGVVGWLPLEHPDETARHLNEVGDGRLVGARHLVNFEADPDWLARPGVEDSLRLLAERGLAFDVVPVAEEHFRHMVGLAEAVPNLTIVVDHLGNPPVVKGGWQPWADQMAELAQSDDVCVKLSVGIALLSEISTLDELDLGRYVDHVLEQFGPNRILWASNWPVINLAADYGTALRRLRELVGALDEHEQAQVMGLTARRVYGLEDAAGPP